MPRSVKEWVGKTDDSRPPDRVRIRVWERCLHACHACERIILTGEKWILEHRVALINGGENRESNLCLTCPNCLPTKNAADMAEKSKVARTRKKHVLTRTPSRGLRAPDPKAWEYDWQARRYVRIHRTETTNGR